MTFYKPNIVPLNWFNDNGRKGSYSSPPPLLLLEPLLPELLFLLLFDFAAGAVRLLLTAGLREGVAERVLVREGVDVLERALGVLDRLFTLGDELRLTLDEPDTFSLLVGIRLVEEEERARVLLCVERSIRVLEFRLGFWL